MNDSQLDATVPVIDFSSLPLVETAADLRPIGLQLLKTLLEGGEWPSLAPLLSPSLVELLLPGAGITVLPITYGASRLQRWRRRQSPEIQYNDLVDRAVRKQISSLVWRQTVNDRLRLALFGHPPKSIPPIFWSIIGEMTWGDLEVQRRASQAIYDYLRPYYLFHPGFGAAARLSPKTFWALIALASPFPGGLALTANRRGRYMAAHHLQQIARESLMAEGWASFWDQWALWQVWRRWSAAFDPETELYAVLTALPLFSQLSESPISPVASSLDNRTPRRLATPDWEKEIPHWFLSQYQDRNWRFEPG